MRLFSRRSRAPGAGTDDTGETLRILSGYVLHMSITSLGDGDITPLYEDYMNDPRLGDFGRRELTHAFRALRTRKSPVKA
jgi:hypothetical protein